MSRSLTTEEFVDKARKVHGDKYSYDNVNYISSKEKVSITCKVHGDFQMQPSNHIFGQKCPKCSREGLFTTTESFIKKAIAVHGDKYSYDETVYIHSDKKVKIYCKKHRQFFEQVSRTHLSGKGCPICGNSDRGDHGRHNLETFVKKSRSIHGDYYGYSEVVYANSRNHVKIYCPDHDGFFYQQPDSHTRGAGCNVCAKTRKSTTEEFIEKARLIHGDRYSYEHVDYKGSMSSVDIYCVEHKKIFPQTPNSHLKGSGCPLCHNSIGEVAVMDFLSKHNIEYRCQYPLFKMRCDFYLPAYNTIIEYNGKQHYKPIDFFGGIKTLLAQAKRDIIKKHYCLNSGIRFIAIPYWNIDSISSILSHRLNIKTQIP